MSSGKLPRSDFFQLYPDLNHLSCQENRCQFRHSLGSLRIRNHHAADHESTRQTPHVLKKDKPPPSVGMAAAGQKTVFQARAAVTCR